MIAIIFWVLWVIFALYGGWSGFRPNGDRLLVGGHALVSILLFLVGLRLFPVAL